MQRLKAHIIRIVGTGLVGGTIGATLFYSFPSVFPSTIVAPGFLIGFTVSGIDAILYISWPTIKRWIWGR